MCISYFCHWYLCLALFPRYLHFFSSLFATDLEQSFISVMIVTIVAIISFSVGSSVDSSKLYYMRFCIWKGSQKLK